MRAYKLFRVDKDGDLRSLFIDKRRKLPLNEWMDAEEIPTKGFFVRGGWHCCFKPEAPHLSIHPKNGMKRVWREVEIEDYSEIQKPESQGGKWILANRIKIL